MVKKESKSDGFLLLKKKQKAKPLFLARYAIDELVTRERAKLYN